MTHVYKSVWLCPQEACEWVGGVCTAQERKWGRRGAARQPQCGCCEGAGPGRGQRGGANAAPSGRRARHRLCEVALPLQPEPRQRRGVGGVGGWLFHRPAPRMAAVLARRGHQRPWGVRGEGGAVSFL